MSPVGYYVHHHGHGHLHRALRLARELHGRAHEVTFLSSLPDPGGHDGHWLQLPRDDDGEPCEPTAGGLLHWAPLGHDGLRTRHALISAWIERARPDVVVCDVSQEVAVLCRLHGVPVVSVVLPGHRDDPAHLLGLGLSSRVVAFWPEEADRMLHGLPLDLRLRVLPLGALARYAPASLPAEVSERRVVVMGGAGGAAWDEGELADFCRGLTGWTCEVLGGGGRWTAHPWPVLRSARVVITHAGQNALAEVAAARVPALVVPAPRPFDEQVTTASQLAEGGWPVRVASGLPVAADAVLDEVAALDGAGWSAWNDGGAAGRFADVVDDVVGAS